MSLTRRKELSGTKREIIFTTTIFIVNITLSIASNIIIKLVRYYRDTYAEHPEDRKNIEYSVLLKMDNMMIMMMAIGHLSNDNHVRDYDDRKRSGPPGQR